MTERAARTIFALSSGAPPAAIAIIRISGPAAGAALAMLAGRLPKPRHATLATLRDPGDGVLLDRALLLWNPGPASATGEDLVELHVHGGRAVVAAVLGALSRIAGLRAAEPGEFTRRAFENGRIDLAEAEALGDLLAAESEAQRRAAIAGVEGHLSRIVEGWRERLVDMAAMLETEIEFSDEDDVIATADIALGLEHLRDDIAAVLASPPAERLREGVRIVIAGPPNAGKSSLLNALAGREAALVSPLPGTTRDVIEAPIVIDGLPFLLCDTAGLRDSGDEVERMGVVAAERRIATADILLWLGAGNAAPQHASCVRVGSKADLGQRPADIDLSVSALTGEGLAALRAEVRERAAAALPSDSVALNLRQAGLGREALAKLDIAMCEKDPLLRAHLLRGCCERIDQIAGHASVEHVLDSVFSRFCIGK